MAAPKIVQYDSIYRGDTPVFAFIFQNLGLTYNWSGTKVDFAMTAATAPTDNSQAAVLRQNVSLVVDATNTASVSFQPTPLEANTFVPGKTYNVQIQAKDNAGANVVTVSTGKIQILQDYII